MLRLTGRVQDYAWGSTTAIPELLGVQCDGRPQAELWLGAHPGAPADADGEPLDELVSADPPRHLGAPSVSAFGPRLPFLLKVLAAAEPLSLQAHPSREQAEAGHAREDAAGVAADAPDRVFKDDWPKPEAICALGDFELLHGFRDPQETSDFFAALGVAEATDLVAPLGKAGAGTAEVKEAFGRLLRQGVEHAQLVGDVVRAAGAHESDDGPVGDYARLATLLGGLHPDDPGVLAALMMNRCTLHHHEALFSPAGNLHAYLKGTGIEVLANSDNVLRGGLTSKHVDVEGLLDILDFTPAAPELVAAVEERPGVVAYRTPAPEFAFWRLDLSDGSGPVPVPGAGSGRIVLVTDGCAELTGGASTQHLDRGQSIYLDADEQVTAVGDGNAFVAASGVR